MKGHPELRYLNVAVQADYLADICDVLDRDATNFACVALLRNLIARQTGRKIYKLGDEVKVLGAGEGRIIKENNPEDDYHVMILISGTEHIVIAHSSTILLIRRNE